MSGRTLAPVDPAWYPSFGLEPSTAADVSQASMAAKMFVSQFAAEVARSGTRRKA